MLFSEAGEAGGGEYAVFIRDTNGAPAVRLGQGTSRALSPDGQWALVLRQNMNPPDFVLLPVGVGQLRPLSTGKVTPNRGEFLADSKGIVFDGHEPGHASRIYIMSLDSAQPRPLTPEGYTLRGPVVSPDGKRLVVMNAEGLSEVSIEGGQPQLGEALRPGIASLPGQKTDRAGSSVKTIETACTVSRLDPQTGARTPWRSI